MYSTTGRSPYPPQDYGRRTCDRYRYRSCTLRSVSTYVTPRGISSRNSLKEPIATHEAIDFEFRTGTHAHSILPLCGRPRVGRGGVLFNPLIEPFRATLLSYFEIDTALPIQSLFNVYYLFVISTYHLTLFIITLIQFNLLL